MSRAYNKGASDALNGNNFDPRYYDNVDYTCAYNMMMDYLEGVYSQPKPDYPEPTIEDYCGSDGHPPYYVVAYGLVSGLKRNVYSICYCGSAKYTILQHYWWSIKNKFKQAWNDFTEEL